MNRQLLEEPFDKSLLKTRKGTFGNTFSYIEAQHFIRRLQEAFEGEWSFSIEEHTIRDNEVIIIGKLSAGGVTKMAFGGSKITISREGEVVSIADDLKAAATDALKKASSLLGVGLHLYSEPTDSASSGNGRSSPTSHQRRGNSGNNGKSNGNERSKPAGNNGNGRDRLTQKQLSCIWGMARSLGRSVEEVRQHTMDAYGGQPEQMSKADASSFITELGEALSQTGGTA